LRRLHAPIPPIRLRRRDARRRRRRLADQLLGPEATLRAGRAGTAGGWSGLAVGRSAPLPALAASDRRRRRSGMGRGTRAWHRDAGRTGGDHQRRLRQPAALHLPWVLPARLQGERQSQPAGNSRPRRDRAWCRDPFRLDGGARRGRWVGALHGRHLPPRRPGTVSAGGSRDGVRLLDRETPAGVGNSADRVGRYLVVKGAPQVAGRFPELLRMYTAPPLEVSSEQFYAT